MTDRDVIMAKAAAVRNHLGRIVEKRSHDLPVFLEDIDCQEIVLFNIEDSPRQATGNLHRKEKN